MGQDKYIRFDWAAKSLLRHKENFVILEGLISVLLKEEIHITDILESEGNQKDRNDKFNRVDVKARNSKGEIIIIEIQLRRQSYYFERVLYGVSKSITEHISLGDRYDQVKKVYSISIIYFDLGKGSDYIYHGQTKFIGMTTGDTLQITKRENNVIQIQAPESIFPEYYIIRVHQYNKPEAVSYIEEWIDFLRTGHIKEDTQAPGLKEARERLLYMNMSDSEKKAYDRHLDDIMVENDIFYTAIEDGKEIGFTKGIEAGIAKGIAKGIAEGMVIGEKKGRKEGEAIGLEKGIEKGKLETAAMMKHDGVPIDAICRYTGLTEEQIQKILGGDIH